MQPRNFLHIRSARGTTTRRVQLVTDVVRVGGSAFCEVRLSGTTVGDVEAFLRRQGRTWFLQPTGSRSRIYQGETLITERIQIGSGTVFRIGDYLLEFQAEGAADSAPEVGSFQDPISVEPTLLASEEVNQVGVNSPSHAAVEISPPVKEPLVDFTSRNTSNLDSPPTNLEQVVSDNSGSTSADLPVSESSIIDATVRSSSESTLSAPERGPNSGANWQTTLDRCEKWLQDTRAKRTEPAPRLTGLLPSHPLPDSKAATHYRTRDWAPKVPLNTGVRPATQPISNEPPASGTEQMGLNPLTPQGATGEPRVLTKPESRPDVRSDEVDVFLDPEELIGRAAWESSISNNTSEHTAPTQEIPRHESIEIHSDTHSPTDSVTGMGQASLEPITCLSTSFDTLDFTPNPSVDYAISTAELSSYERETSGTTEQDRPAFLSQSVVDGPAQINLLDLKCQNLCETPDLKNLHPISQGLQSDPIAVESSNASVSHENDPPLEESLSQSLVGDLNLKPMESLESTQAASHPVSPQNSDVVSSPEDGLPTIAMILAARNSSIQPASFEQHSATLEEKLRTKTVLDVVSPTAAETVAMRLLEPELPDSIHVSAKIPGLVFIGLMLILGGVCTAMIVLWGLDQQRAATVQKLTRSPGESNSISSLEPKALSKWWASTADNLFEEGVLLLGEKDSEVQSRGRDLIDLAENASPWHSGVGMLRLNESSRSGVSQGVPRSPSRDILALVESARIAFASKNKEIAITYLEEASRMAMNTKIQEIVPPGPSSVDRNPRWMLPQEILFVPICKVVFEQKLLPPQEVMGQLPAYGPLQLAAARQARGVSRSEGDRYLTRVLTLDETPPGGGSPLLQRAAQAEALALLGRWSESQSAYEELLKQKSPSRLEAICWANLAANFGQISDINRMNASRRNARRLGLDVAAGAAGANSSDGSSGTRSR